MLQWTSVSRCRDNAWHKFLTLQSAVNAAGYRANMFWKEGQSSLLNTNDCWLYGHCRDISLNVLANPIMSAWVCIDANYSADTREIRCSQTGFLLDLRNMVYDNHLFRLPSWLDVSLLLSQPFPCNYCIQNNARIMLGMAATSHADLIASGCACSWSQGSII